MSTARLIVGIAMIYAPTLSALQQDVEPPRATHTESPKVSGKSDGQQGAKGPVAPLVSKRTRDVFQLSTGEVLDLYRLNAIRDMVAGKSKWDQIKPTTLLEFGAGHVRFSSSGALTNQQFGTFAELPEGHSFVGLPPLAALLTSPTERTRDWVVFLQRVTIGPDSDAPRGIDQTVPVTEVGDRTLYYRPSALRVSGVLADGAVVEFFGYAKTEDPPFGLPEDEFFLRGDFAGLADGEAVGGDFVLLPGGTQKIATALGGTRTLRAYRLERLVTPIPEATLLTLVESRAIDLKRFLRSTTATKTVWKQFSINPEPASKPRTK